MSTCKRNTINQLKTSYIVGREGPAEDRRES
jgi:hypothetical protein